MARQGSLPSHKTFQTPNSHADWGCWWEVGTTGRELVNLLAGLRCKNQGHFQHRNVAAVWMQSLSTQTGCRQQGRNREEDKGGQMEGTGVAQRVSFAIGWGVSLLDLSKTKQNKTKKTQIPCQTRRAIALSLGLQALFLKSNEHYLTRSHCWGHPDPMTLGFLMCFALQLSSKLSST